jgi:hypothetical protein
MTISQGDLEKARELRERARLPENAGNLAAMMILMAEELEQCAREKLVREKSLQQEQPCDCR